jgi:anti-sigma regulatory factor (Ser/Thr protein kinase)
VTAAGAVELLLDKEFTVADLAKLRSLIADCAAVAGLPAERGGEFVLVAHELIANAIEHGGGRGQVQVFCADGELHCRVHDRGPGVSSDAVPSQLSALAILDGGEGGCGLWIVRELADRLVIGANGAGAIVTASLRINRG